MPVRPPKPRYIRTPPETVRAVQWRPGRRPAGIVMEVPASPGAPALLPFPVHAVLRTLQGNFTVFAGDWIVTEPSGHQHVVPDRSFELCYVALKGQQEIFAPRDTHNEATHRGAAQ